MPIPRSARSGRVAVVLAVLVLGIWPALVSAAAPSPSLTNTCKLFPGNTTVTWSHQNPGVTALQIRFFDSTNTQLGGGVDATYGGNGKAKGQVTDPTTSGAAYAKVTIQWGGSVAAEYFPSCT